MMTTLNRFLDDFVFALKLHHSQDYEKIQHVATNYQKMSVIHRLCSSDLLSKFSVDTVMPQKEGLKSADQAQCLKSRGNDFFVRKQLDEALSFYNRAMLAAPHTSSEYAYCLGNRSAVFFDMKKYDLCVQDIDDALRTGLMPEAKQYKILLRKTSCLIEVGRLKEAMQALESLLQDAGGDKTVNGSKLVDQVENLRQALLKKQSCGPQQPKKTKALQESIILHMDPKLPSCVPGIECKYSKDVGRHLCSTQNIPVGTLIMVDTPFSAVLLPEHEKMSCHHCLKPLSGAIQPCSRCSNVAFCSKACEAKAGSIYHKIECQMLPFLHSIGLAHLSFRLVLTAGVSKLWEKFLQTHDGCTDSSSCVAKDVSKFNKNRGFIDGVYNGLNYETVLCLVTHAKQCNRDDTLRFALTAYILAVLLRKTEFFDDLKNLSRNGPMAKADASCKQITRPNFELFVASLIVHHLQQLICNAMGILSLRALRERGNGDNPTNKTYEVDLLTFGTGIYPTASLMNHSCDPNISTYWDGSKMFVKTARDIVAGEELFNCYGPDCHRMVRSARQRTLLEQYYFTCKCTACVGGLELRWNALKCGRCEGALCTGAEGAVNGGGAEANVMKCLDCEQIELDARRRTQEYKQLRECERKCKTMFETDGATADVGEALTACYNEAERILYKHHRSLGNITKMLARYCTESGQRSEMVTFMQKSVQVSRAIYGARSIAVAHELQTLSDSHKVLAFNELAMAQEYYKKAQEAIRVFKGSRSDPTSILADETVSEMQKLSDLHRTKAFDERSKAVECLQEAKQIFCLLYYEGHAEVLWINEALEELALE